MFDFSAYIQNEWSWAVLALMAIFVGMSKTGITRMPKLAFVGTNAWFFLCVNFLKLPFQLFDWHNINLTTLAIASILGNRYNPNQEEALQKELEHGLARMLAIRLDIEHLTGKEAIELVRQRQQS